MENNIDKENLSEESEKYKKAQSSAFFNFLMEIINYAALIVSVTLTFSLSIIMDMMSSTCNLTRTGICFFLNRKMQKNLKYVYNYGGDRLEILATVFCDFLMVLGSLFILAFAVYRIVVPSAVSDLIIVAVIFKVICVIADVAILIPAYSAYKKTKTKVSRTVFEGMVSSFAFDAGVLLAVLLSMILKNWEFVGYVEPIISIIIATITIIRAINRIRIGVAELTDLTLDEETKLNITNIINSHFKEFDLVHDIKSHRFGQKIIVDLDFGFSPTTTYEEMKHLINKISTEVQVKFPESSVDLIITNERT